MTRIILGLAILILSSAGYSGGIIVPGGGTQYGLYCVSLSSDPMRSEDLEVQIGEEFGRSIAEVYEYRGDFRSLIGRTAVGRRPLFDDVTEAIYLYRDGSAFRLSLYYEEAGEFRDDQLAHLHLDLGRRLIEEDLACIYR